MSMTEYKKSQKEMKRQKDVQDQFNDAVSATIPLQEAMTEAFKSIASNEDFINMILGTVELIKTLAEWFAKFNKITNGWAVIVVGIVAGLAGLAGILAPLAMGLATVTGAMGGLSGAFTGFTSVITSLGAAFSGGMVVAAKGLGILLAVMAAAAIIFVVFAGAARILGSAMKDFGSVNISKITTDLLAFMAAMSFSAIGAVTSSVGMLGLAGSIGGIATELERLQKVLPSASKDMAKFVNDIFGIDQMVNIQVVFTDLVEGITSIKDAVSNITGTDAIRFHSTLENMALISSGAASFAGGQAAVNMFQPLINLQSPDINNEINLGKLEIVLDNGDTLTGFIRKTVKGRD
jgi:hypothetical protein